LRYPIFNTFNTGESPALCAEDPNNSNTFGRKEGSMRLILLNIPRFEPRALSPRTRCSIVASRMYGRYHGRLVVYPGCIGRLHTQGGVYLPYPPGGHIQPCTPLPYSPGRHIQPCTPYVHPWDTLCTPWIPYVPLGYPMYTLVYLRLREINPGIPPS